MYVYPFVLLQGVSISHSKMLLCVIGVCVRFLLIPQTVFSCRGSYGLVSKGACLRNRSVRAHGAVKRSPAQLLTVNLDGSGTFYSKILSGALGVSGWLLGSSWVHPGCLLGVSWVLLGASWVSLGCLLGVSWALLGATGCLLVAPGCLLAAPWCSWVSPGCSWVSAWCSLVSAGCSWVLLVDPGCSWVLPGAPGCSWVSPWYSWVLLCALGAPGSSWVLLGAPGVHLGVLGASGCLLRAPKGLLGAS